MRILAALAIFSAEPSKAAAAAQEFLPMPTSPRSTSGHPQSHTQSQPAPFGSSEFNESSIIIGERDKPDPGPSTDQVPAAAQHVNPGSQGPNVVTINRMDGSTILAIDLGEETQRQVLLVKADVEKYMLEHGEHIPRWKYAISLEFKTRELSDADFVEAGNEYTLLKTLRYKRSTILLDDDETIKLETLPDLSSADTYDPNDHKAIYDFEDNVNMLEKLELAYEILKGAAYFLSLPDEKKRDLSQLPWFPMSPSKFHGFINTETEDNTFAYISYYHQLSGSIIFRKYRMFNGELKMTTYRIRKVEDESNDEYRGSSTELSRFEPDTENDARFLRKHYDLLFELEKCLVVNDRVLLFYVPN